MQAESYSIIIKYLTDQNCYEARVLELPDLSDYGDTYEEAYELIIDSINTTMEVMAVKGRSMPLPYNGQDDYSGRITLRLPKTLHASITHIAEREGVSLNQMVATVLAGYKGFDSAMDNTKEGWVRLGSKKASINLQRPTLKRIVSEPGAVGHSDWQDSPRLQAV